MVVCKELGLQNAGSSADASRWSAIATTSIVTNPASIIRTPALAIIVTDMFLGRIARCCIIIRLNRFVLWVEGIR